MNIFEKLIAAGLPVLSATEDGAIESTAMTDEQRVLFQQIINEHFGIQEPTMQTFEIPIQAPAIYVEDIFVSSRKIKDDPDEAFAEVEFESEKPHGEPKSLDLIARSHTRMIRKLQNENDKLEKRLKKLEKS